MLLADFLGTLLTGLSDNVIRIGKSRSDTSINANRLAMGLGIQRFVDQSIRSSVALARDPGVGHFKRDPPGRQGKFAQGRVPDRPSA